VGARRERKRRLSLLPALFRRAIWRDIDVITKAGLVQQLFLAGCGSGERGARTSNCGASSSGRPRRLRSVPSRMPRGKFEVKRLANGKTVEVREKLLLLTQAFHIRLLRKLRCGFFAVGIDVFLVVLESRKKIVTLFAE
jgi:hypothetical protein